VSGSHLKPVTRFLFFVWQLPVSWSGAPSLTRGSVCNLLLQLLLCLARAVTLGYESRRTHDHILLSHLRFPHSKLGPGPRIYILQEHSGPVLPPGTGFPFRRLLGLAGIRWKCSNPPQLIFKLKVEVTLRLTISQYIVVSSPLWDLWPDIASCPKLEMWRSGLSFVSLSL
jgi:hypothetical protein